MVITMTTYSTADEFLAAEIALWGFEEIERLLALGAEIVVDPVRGFKWSLRGVDKEREVC